MGLDKTVEHLIDYQGVDDSALEKRLDAMGLDIIEKPGQLMQWLMLRMAYTARPFQEKMTLFWHGLLTSAFTKVGKGSAMFDQNQLYRENALGKYDVLLRAVSRDPAMLIYLDSARNRKQAPNENFARELMELFTMGEGNYTEEDVRESARAFAGWGLQKREFVFRRQWHDYGLKQFLGRQGDLDGDDVIDTIMMQPVTADYISRRPFSFFAYDNPDDLTVERLAGKFRNGGYSVKPVMEDILTSDEFYSDRAYRAKIKSPDRARRGDLPDPRHRHRRQAHTGEPRRPGADAVQSAERGRLAGRRLLDQQQHAARAGELRPRRGPAKRPVPPPASAYGQGGRLRDRGLQPGRLLRRAAARRQHPARRPGGLDRVRRRHREGRGRLAAEPAARVRRADQCRLPAPLIAGLSPGVTAQGTRRRC